MLNDRKISAKLLAGFLTSLVICGTPASGESTLRSEIRSVPAAHRNAHWTSVEDAANSETLTLSSLILSSTLIVRIRPERIIFEVARGPRLFQFKAVRITGFVKRGIGPDASLTPGEEIIVVDLVHNSRTPGGEEFMNDLALLPSDDAVVFLQRLPSRMRINGLSLTAYRFTAPMVSKYALDETGRMIPMSVRRTALSQALRLQNVSSIFSLATGAPGRSVSESYAQAVLISRRQNVMSQKLLEMGLSRAPWEVEAAFAASDARAAQVR